MLAEVICIHKLQDRSHSLSSREKSCFVTCATSQKTAVIEFKMDGLFFGGGGHMSQKTYLKVNR